MPQSEKRKSRETLIDDIYSEPAKGDKNRVKLGNKPRNSRETSVDDLTGVSRASNSSLSSDKYTGV